jgi:hypothetical protein
MRPNNKNMKHNLCNSKPGSAVTIVIIAPLNSQKFPLSNNIYFTENCKPESKGQTKTMIQLSFILETQRCLTLPFATMARPHLYNTPEEKKAARAAISKELSKVCNLLCLCKKNLLNLHRHRDHINEQRRKKYHKHLKKLSGKTQKK